MLCYKKLWNGSNVVESIGTNHFLINHNIYNTLDDKSKDDTDYNNDINNNIVDDYKNTQYCSLFIQELFDKIHCHYKHSFDIFILTKNAKKQINTIKKIQINIFNDSSWLLLKGNINQNINMWAVPMPGCVIIDGYN